MTGGGSGGHITPILAVAAELKALRPDVHLIYIGQRGDQLSDVPAESKFIDEVYTVSAGKLRRYHGEGIKQLLDVPTMAKNVRDIWRVLAGTIQCYRLLGKIKPDCIFIKGGFVGLPVGLAAARRQVPFVTHDSDALPGLTNRIIARWAALHTVALPKEVYNYPAGKTVAVGVPLQAEFQPVDVSRQKAYRRQLGLNDAAKILFITGGGNGALSLNNAVAGFVPALLDTYPDMLVIHVAGRMHEALFARKYDELLNPEQRRRVIVKGFVTELHAYSGAADVVITRAGATNLAEFATQHKACIVVPNPMLAGGHQTKNAEYLAGQQAIICVTEAELTDRPQAMEQAVRNLFDNPDVCREMGERFAEYARPDAARQLAVILLDEAKK